MIYLALAAGLGAGIAAGIFFAYFQLRGTVNTLSLLNQSLTDRLHASTYAEYKAIAEPFYPAPRPRTRLRTDHTGLVRERVPIGDDDGER